MTLDLGAYPILRYHASGTPEERHAARDACCRRYGQEVVDHGQLWRHIGDELREFRRLKPCPPDLPDDVEPIL